MTQAITRSARRSPSPSLADRLYPRGSQTDDDQTGADQGEQTPTDGPEDDTADEGDAKRAPAPDAASRLYPDDKATEGDVAVKNEGRTPAAGQDSDASQKQDGAAAQTWPIAELKSQTVRAFLQGDPLAILPNGGVKPAPTVAEQNDRDVQALALLMSKISDKECPLLEKDIGLEKGTIEQLRRAIKEGKPMEAYGLTPHADSNGYVNKEIVSKKSYTYQGLLKLLESDRWRTFRDNALEKTGRVLTQDRNRTDAWIERGRSESVLNGMIEAYDKYCKK